MQPIEIDVCVSLLSDEIRDQCVSLLLTEISPDVWDEIRQAIADLGEDWWIGHHMFFGMGIRNLLRSLVLDKDLPVCYPMSGYQGWDDFWVGLVELAAKEEHLG